MDLRNELYEEVVELYNKSIDEIEYRPSKMMYLITKYKQENIELPIKKMIMNPNYDAFYKLVKKDRYDLTLEFLVIKDKYRELFTQEEINKAKETLKIFNKNF